MLRTICCLLAVASLLTAEVIWWEGEAATAHQFDNRSFAPAGYGEKSGELSGGDWLHTGGQRHGQPLDATWTVEVPAPGGTWHFLTRKFWKHGPFRWHFDAGPWTTCDADCALLDHTDLAPNICVNWVALGDVTLSAGAHTLTIELLAADGTNAPAAFDCFVLSKPPFAPRGRLKPGERYDLAAPGWWSFEPDADSFANGALLDFRSLNEAQAGAHGAISAQGAGFVRGDGQAIRFYGVNTAVPELDDAQLDYFAARLAKCGINLVRIHGFLADRQSTDPLAIDAKRLDRVHALVAALKKQGIYSHLSTFFPLWMEVKPGDGIAGERGDAHPFGLLFFDARMQALHRAWLQRSLTAKNPYTGLSLAADPALAMVEIINEDSLFFWTFSERMVGSQQWQALEIRFATWMENRPRDAWQETTHEHDAAGRLGLYEAWNLTGDGLAKSGAGPRARALDQIRFYAELQHTFYADTSAWLRRECHLSGTISASNWITADDGTLGLIERWTYTGADVADRHGYFGGKHEGEAAGYSVRAGHTFADRCALLHPEELPIAVTQLADRPQLISEIAWNKPNRFIADYQPVISSYAALQGISGICLFAVANGNWASDGGGKWTLAMPGELGQVPAAALQFRRGDLTPGATVLRRVISSSDLHQANGTGLGEGHGVDVRVGGAASTTTSDPLAFFLGRVECTYSAEAKPLTQAASDPAAHLLTSTTKQLQWDYGLGLLRIDSPRSQGVTGFLAKAGVVSLSTVQITSQMEYGTIWAISLDDQPLTRSKRILVQAFSEERMYGFATDQERITDIGRAPINVRDIVGTLNLPGRCRGTILDANGYPNGPAHVVCEKNRSTLTLPAHALYTVLLRD